MDEEPRPGAVAFRHVPCIRFLIGTKVGNELARAFRTLTFNQVAVTTGRPFWSSSRLCIRNLRGSKQQPVINFRNIDILIKAFYLFSIFLTFHSDITLSHSFVFAAKIGRKGITKVLFRVSVFGDFCSKKTQVSRNQQK